MHDTIHFDLSPPSDDDRRRLEGELSDDERRVLLEHGTEAPFCGVFLEEKRPGAYTCRLCGLPLFKGGAKFDEPKVPEAAASAASAASAAAK